jgi:hypothetical protein
MIPSWSQGGFSKFLEFTRSSGLVLTSAALFTGGSERQGSPDPC